MPVIVFTGITRNNTDVVSRNSSGINLNASALNPLVINPGDVMHFYYKAASSTSSNAYSDCWGEYGNNGSITCCGIKIVVDNGGVFTQNWSRSYSNLMTEGVVIDYSNTIMENMFWSSYATDEMREQRYFGWGSSGPELSLVYYYNGPNNPSTTSTQTIKLKFNFPQLSGLTMSSPSIEALTNNSVSFSWNRPTQINETIAIRNAVSSRTFYNIYQKSESGEVNELTAKQITGFTNSEESRVINGLQADSRFCFGVRAVGDGLYYSSSTNLAVISGYTMALYNKKFTSRSQLPSGTNRLRQDGCSVETSITGITGLEVNTDYKVDINLESDGVYHVSSQTINRIARTPNGMGFEWVPTALTFTFYDLSPQTSNLYLYNFVSPVLGTTTDSNSLSEINYNGIADDETNGIFPFTVSPKSFITTANTNKVWKFYYFSDDWSENGFTQAEGRKTLLTVTQQAPSSVVERTLNFYFEPNQIGTSYKKRITFPVSNVIVFSTRKGVNGSYTSIEFTNDGTSWYVYASNVEDGNITCEAEILGYRNSENVLYKLNIVVLIKGRDTSNSVVQLKEYPEDNVGDTIIDWYTFLEDNPDFDFHVEDNVIELRGGNYPDGGAEVILPNIAIYQGDMMSSPLHGNFDKLKAIYVLDGVVYEAIPMTGQDSSTDVWVFNPPQTVHAHINDNLLIYLWYEGGNITIENNQYDYLFGEV